MRNKLANALVVLFCFPFLVLNSYSQDNLVIGFNAHYGFIWAHHPEIQYVIQGHIPAFEINIAKPTYGDKIWQQRYHYPDMGICFLHVDLGNPAILGNADAISGYMNFPLVSERKFNLNFRVGAGIAYLTKKFDRLDDHKNMVIGSHIDGTANLRLNTKIHLSDHLIMEAGLGMTHFSNGAFALPNLGLNIPTVNLGASYILGKKHEKIVTDTIISINKKMEYLVYVTGGVTEINPPGSNKYFAYTFSFVAGKRLTYMSRFNLGLDFFYNPANIKNLKQDTITLSNNLQNVQVGIKLGYELVISRLSIPIEMGTFLYTKYTGSGYLYHRLGLRYRITEHIIANVTLKTFWAKADYIEWGGAYRF